MNPAAEINALALQLSTDNLATWSDEKRKSFTETFDARVRVARYLLYRTAIYVAQKAKEKHFISDKHDRQFPNHWQSIPDELYDRKPGSYYHENAVGGRDLQELEVIARERADEIIKQLPGLTDAVRILSPEVGQMIEKRSKLLAKGKQLLEEAEGLAGSLDMDDLDQEMTIAAFRAMVKDREKKRASLLSKLDDVGEEGRALDSRINKFLYDGLPGLSDAVIKVIKDYLDRSLGFSAMNRRVAEQVQFGDSEAAMEMLKTFEKDEATISSDIKAQFDQALDELKVAAKKGLATSRLKKLAAPGKK